MQIDFHHAVTYVAARIAGFPHDAAATIAYAAQYVDDATSSGVVCFDTGAMYFRSSSAHKMLDPDNLVNAENHLSWLPFHFLPGGDELVGDQNLGSFTRKIVCKPASLPAQAMVAAALADKGMPYALHRLGIAMHVYADTWAHQGFAGVLDDINDVIGAEDIGKSGVFGSSLWDALTSEVEANLPPIGHARAGVLPDMPFLHWKYTNGAGQVINRDNTDFFVDAAIAICKAMQQYLGKPQLGIGQADLQVIQALFSGTLDQDGEVRHKVWLGAIEQGRFSFGAATISYADDGRDSWKAAALGTSADMPVHKYPADFLQSDWKLFHDALQQHRITLLHHILPRYGICAG